jgi:hypothetical protein
MQFGEQIEVRVLMTLVGCFAGLEGISREGVGCCI